jgi:hypothetical protein
MENITLPNNFELLSETDKYLVKTYLNSLSNTEKQAYIIAKSHLGSSFNLFKSNGYKNWQKHITTT